MVVFHRPRDPLPGDLAVQVGKYRVPLSPSIKYFGVHLNEHLNYKMHLNRIEDKASSYTRTLSRFMPNLRGPSEKKRKLYANAIASVILYAAPVWADTVMRSRALRAQIRRLQRTYTLRMISAYHSVSADAACLLARTPPLDLLTDARRRLYLRIQDLKRVDAWSARGERGVREQELALLRTQWRIWLDRRDVSGVRTMKAIRPVFLQWLECDWIRLGFHLTQLLTDCGSFGSFLFRIDKSSSPDYMFCDAEVDSLEHTISECPQWLADRDLLVSAVGEDLSLPALTRFIVFSEVAWGAFSRFATSVMKAKELVERVNRPSRLGWMFTSLPPQWSVSSLNEEGADRSRPERLY